MHGNVLRTTLDNCLQDCLSFFIYLLSIFLSSYLPTTVPASMERHQYKKRLWTKEEDQILMEYLSAHGRGRWNDIAKATGDFGSIFFRILWCESNYYRFSFSICLVCYQTCGAGLKRSGRSCRSRWMNYLCPNVKHGEFSEEEEELIIRLHNLLGNRSPLPLPPFLFYLSSYFLPSILQARTECSA